MSERRWTGRREVVVWAIAIGTIVLPVLGVTAYHILQTTQADARALGLPIPVQTIPAKVEALDEIVGGSGIAQASQPVNINAKIVARVLRVPVEVGAVVHPGDLLVEFDPELYQSNYESEQLGYQHFHNELKRTESLARQAFSSPEDLENARVAEARARVALVSAKIDLENTRILSPVSAVVLSRSINPGEMSHIDESCVQLGVIDPFLMEVAVSEDKIGYVYEGMDAEVETDAFPGETFKGQVTRIDAAVDVMTRTFGVYVQIPNHDLRLKKGVTGYARLKSRRTALVVPSTAVIDLNGDRSMVYVIDASRHVHVREIRGGISALGMTEITRGLREGEEVVSVGQAGLRDNDEVLLNRNAPWNK
jgi:membrane fusion protein, multidrug efflux system